MPDDVTTLAELKSAVARFSDERDWAQFHGAKDLAIGIATEAAELLELFRFQPESTIDDRMTDPELRRRVESEIADVLFFVVRLAQRYEIDVSAAFARKLARNAERYPVAKARGSTGSRAFTELWAGLSTHFIRDSSRNQIAEKLKAAFFAAYRYDCRR